MDIQLEEHPNLTIINIAGEFQIENIKSFVEVWETEIKKKTRTIAINLMKLEYIDSPGLSILVKIHKSSIHESINLLFFGMNPAIRNILRITNLDTIFTITTRDIIAKDFQL